MKGNLFGTVQFKSILTALQYILTFLCYLHFFQNWMISTETFDQKGKIRGHWVYNCEKVALGDKPMQKRGSSDKHLAYPGQWPRQQTHV